MHLHHLPRINPESPPLQARRDRNLGLIISLGINQQDTSLQLHRRHERLRTNQSDRGLVFWGAQGEVRSQRPFRYQLESQEVQHQESFESALPVIW